MRTKTRLSVVTFAFLASVAAQTSSLSKRGLSQVDDTEAGDYQIFLSANAPISWYYTWSPWSSKYLVNSSKSLEFVPMLQNLDNLDADINAIKSTAPAQGAYLLTFNEPDGSTDSGGTAIEPKDAAQAYINSIMPLRLGSGGSWRISHPVVTGSSRGLDWLTQFCAECASINGDKGCPTDFVAAHWYGDFAGLASWVGQLHNFYSNTSHSFLSANDSENLGVWVTEMALPQEDDNATETMMNQSLSYLDNLTYVSRYAWFGLFRENSDDAKGWAGQSVALLDDNGALTEIGALYLGGSQNGFKEGDKAQANVAASFWASPGLLVAAVILAIAAAD